MLLMWSKKFIKRRHLGHSDLAALFAAHGSVPHSTPTPQKCPATQRPSGASLGLLFSGGVLERTVTPHALREGVPNLPNTGLAAITRNQKDPGELDHMMEKLDINCDGQLDFPEFLNLIGGLALACHESLNLPRSTAEEPWSWPPDHPLPSSSPALISSQAPAARSPAAHHLCRPFTLVLIKHIF